MGTRRSTHGTRLRGIEAGADPSVGFGRYGRMFDLPPARMLPDEGLRALAEAMIKVDPGAPLTGRDIADENPTVPAGYTYFGQFIDHDITFDPTPLSDQELDLDAMVDFRSPALDLDNVYGRGPDDQPYLYEADGLRLRVGVAPGNGGAKFGTANDHLRLPDGTAILGDPRNDENKLVAQFHAMMVRLHNRVVEDRALIERFGGDFDEPVSRFRAASTIVRWHYQHVVLHDYVVRICMPGTVEAILPAHGVPRVPHYRHAGAAGGYMPVEFAGAAFRLGHSMIRPSYALNAAVVTVPLPGDPPRIPTFSRGEGPQNLNGLPGTLPPDWGLDFGFFLDVEPGAATTGKGFVLPQPSYRLDANLAGPLADLPAFFGPPATKATPMGNLAFRNLERGQMLGLPSGQTVARALGIVPLTDVVLWGAAGSVLLVPGVTEFPGDTKGDWIDTIARRKPVLDGWGEVLKDNAPLWYYVLREAEYFGTGHDPSESGAMFGGQHLGPVGSAIVAETMVGLAWADRGSFLHDRRGFRPDPEIAGGGSLTLASLVKFALG